MKRFFSILSMVYCMCVDETGNKLYLDVQFFTKGFPTTITEGQFCALFPAQHLKSCYVLFFLIGWLFCFIF